MTEKEKTEQEKEETKEEEEGDKAPSPLEESRQLVAEMKQQNEMLREQLNRAEELRAYDMLSGKAEAGKQGRSKEEIGLDNAREFLKGSGYENELFPRNV